LLPYKERKRILEEERLRTSAPARPQARAWTSRLGFLNKPIFLWFMSTVLIGTYTAVSSSERECEARQESDASKLAHVRVEIDGRIFGMITAAVAGDLAGARKQQGPEGSYTYLEYRFRTLRDIIDQYKGLRKTTFDDRFECRVSLSLYGVRLPTAYYHELEYYTRDPDFAAFLDDPDRLIDKGDTTKSVSRLYQALLFHRGTDYASYSFIRKCTFWSRLAGLFAGDEDAPSAPKDAKEYSDIGRDTLVSRDLRLSLGDLIGLWTGASHYTMSRLCNQTSG
jgi:hypothetical protein